MDTLNRWHVAPSQNKDYEFIDGLRGIAILLVVFCHLIYVNPASGWIVKFFGAVAGAGSSGVTLFFALSGFLISWPFWKRKIKNDSNPIPPGYARRRFFKIYPPLALSIILLTPIYIWRTGDFSFSTIALKWLIGLPLFTPISGKLNPVMWSLIIEVQFYIVLPITMLIFRRLSFRICLWLIPLTFLVMGVCRDLSYGLRTVTKMDMSILSIPFPSNLDVFSIGVLVAGLHCRGFLERRFAILGTLGAILFLFMLPIQALAHMKPLEHWEEMILGAFIKLACGLLLLFISNPKSAAVIFLGNPLLRWFGLISYEWYLIHQPLIFWARESFGPAQGSALKYLGVTGGCFLLSLLLGAVIYRIFSLPILRFGRQVGK